jgi:hypothetical protein
MHPLSSLRRASAFVLLVIGFGLLPGCGGETSQSPGLPPAGGLPAATGSSTKAPPDASKGGSNAALDSTITPPTPSK